MPNPPRPVRALGMSTMFPPMSIIQPGIRRHEDVCHPDHSHYKRRVWKKLLRKEVIQPHLPVRLPCYDFVPIASPTFDHSLPCGLGHGLRVLPTFVT